ncbi:uncharacterized protein LOC126723962 [Quercus robur]|uniref:uncharacterized protein LOC126723962 n=1 Tax=Quercus robur TaxID=38942 RepID=UPI00216143EB|nr:uncharacterized protein LOC126723962 [Quercus robur]
MKKSRTVSSNIPKLSQSLFSRTLIFFFKNIQSLQSRLQRAKSREAMRHERIRSVTNKGCNFNMIVDPMRLANLLCRIAFIVYNNLSLTQLINLLKMENEKMIACLFKCFANETMLLNKMHQRRRKIGGGKIATTEFNLIFSFCFSSYLVGEFLIIKQ